MEESASNKQAAGQHLKPRSREDLELGARLRGAEGKASHLRGAQPLPLPPQRPRRQGRAGQGGFLREELQPAPSPRDSRAAPPAPLERCPRGLQPSCGHQGRGTLIPKKLAGSAVRQGAGTTLAGTSSLPMWQAGGRPWQAQGDPRGPTRETPQDHGFFQLLLGLGQEGSRPLRGFRPQRDWVKL